MGVAASKGGGEGGEGIGERGQGEKGLVVRWSLW